MGACVAWVLVSRFPCAGFKVLVWSCSVPPELPWRPSRDLPSRDRPSPFWPCVCCVFKIFDLSLRRTALPWDRPKFRSFFFPLPPEISFFLLSGGLLVEFRWCLNWDPPKCTFGLSGCRVKPRRLRGRGPVETNFGQTDFGQSERFSCV